MSKSTNMFRITCTIILSIFLSCYSFGQYQITGQVLQDNTPLLGATAVVLNSSDSTMIAFGITNDEGTFKLYDIPQGNHIIQVSYTGYLDHSQFFETADEKKIDLGDILLEVSDNILEEVSIKAEHIPMGILGDTVNYNAAAFKTKAGASVEDLLKKLPGIEVARDGSIKAQGKDVENVLVDGKEFFNGNHSIATKNLDAETINKVQVFDKKSDEAEFTGVDDGQEEKTINLELKEEYKKGGFGKAAALTGTNDRYLAKLNYNRFTPSTQVSFIGNANNINQQAFSFRDYLDFMGGLSNLIAQGGMSGLNFVGSQGQSQGISNQYALGTNFNYFHGKKIKLTSNYAFTANKTFLNQYSLRKNFDADQFFETRDSLTSIEKLANHKLYTKFNYKLSPGSEFSVSAKVFGFAVNNDQSRNTQFIRNQQLYSRAANTLMTTGNNINATVNGNYRMKFQKKGRNWTFGSQYDLINQSELNFLTNTILVDNSELLLDQFQDYLLKANNIKATSKFTEPVGKNSFLSLAYMFDAKQENPGRDFYDIEGLSQELNQDLSGDFQKKWTLNQVTLAFRRNRKKRKIYLGSKYAVSDLTATALLEPASTGSSSVYILPFADLELDFPNTRKLKLFYSSQLQAPSLAQLITIPNNQNPTMQVLGNSELKEEYLHNFGFNFSALDQFNFSNLFSNLNFQYSQTKVVYSREFDENFIATIMPIQSPRFWSVRYYLSHSAPIRKLYIKYNIQLNSSYSQYESLLNQNKANISSSLADLDLQVENRNKDKIDIAAGLRLIVSQYTNDLSADFDQNFFQHSWYTEGEFSLFKEIRLNYSYDYRTFNATRLNSAVNLHLINFKLTKKVMNDKLTLIASVNDLLNQNSGIDRTGTLSSVNESQYNVLGRYLLVGLSYKLGRKRS